MTEAGGPTSPAGKRRAEILGERAERVREAVELLDAALAEWSDDFIFGSVWAVSPDISTEEQTLIVIGMLAAQGHIRQMRAYLFGALQQGIPPAKIQAALRLLTVYTGFPRAVMAMHEWSEVQEAARRNGYLGPEAGRNSEHVRPD